MTLSPDTRRVGDLLLAEGIITAEDLQKAAEESGLSDSPLTKSLLGCGHVTREALIPLLAQNFRVPYVNLRELNLSPELAALVPQDVATKHELVPVARMGDILCVAKANYFNRAAVGELRRLTNLRVKVVQCEENQINEALQLIYGTAAPALEVAAEVAVATAPDLLAAPTGGDDALVSTMISESPALPEVVSEPALAADPVVEVAAEAPAVAAEEEILELEEIAEEPAPIEAAPVAEEVAVTGPPPPFFAWPAFQAPAGAEGNRFTATPVSREEVAAVQLALKLDIPAEWEKMYVTERPLQAIRMAK